MSSLVAFIRLSRSDILTNYKSFKMKILMTCHENKLMFNYYESFWLILSMETFSPKEDSFSFRQGEFRVQSILNGLIRAH